MNILNSITIDEDVQKAKEEKLHPAPLVQI